MLQAFVITFREGLEAFLIIAISLAFLRKSGSRHLVPAVQWGIAVSVVLSVFAGWLFSRASNQALWEGVLGGLLMLGALVLYLTNVNQVREISIFSAVLLVQSLPFLAAVGLALVERSPLNEFATWRRLTALSTYRPRLPRGPAPTAGPPTGDKVGILP